MEFYSILFPTQAYEENAKAHPWLTMRKGGVKSGNRFILQGNKYVQATDEKAAPQNEVPILYEDVQMKQVIDAVLDRETDRAEAFYAFCPDERMVAYRQEVMRALETANVREAFEEFCRSTERSIILMDCSKTVHQTAQRDKLLVDGAALYANAIRKLLSDAAHLEIQSEGLSGFLDALRVYAGKPDYLDFETCMHNAKSALERIHYRLRICDGQVLLGFGSEGNDLVRDFVNDFRSAVGPNPAENNEAPRIRLFGQLELCPLETLVIDALQRRYEREFRDLHIIAERMNAIPEQFIARFIREMRFYFRFMDLMNRMRAQGYSFAYPVLSTDDTISIAGAYDLALALKSQGAVDNDLVLTGEERGAVITGANQAGKTTFLRSIGQIAVLSALGLPVPCSNANLPLYQRIFSHFGEAEDSSKDHGKLKEELLRLKPALLSADHHSLILLNEPFSSTTAQDAMDMAEHALSMLVDAGSRVFCVTHIGGLTAERLVSMAAQIDPISHQRLFRIVPAPAESHAYADEIAQKYHLTYRGIKERFAHGI